MANSYSASTVPGPKKSRSIFSIQILRGLAALLVVIGHAQYSAQDLAAVSGRSFQPWNILPWGAGVDLFFVISGFIIFYSSEKYVGDPRARRLFIGHRIARVVPLYWLCTSLQLAPFLVKRLLGFERAGEIPSALQTLASFAFFPFSEQVLPFGLAFPSYNLGWTLNYEMYFYALFCLGVGRAATDSAIRILFVLCSVVILGTLLTPSMLPFAFWCQPITLEFGAGIVIALLFRNGATLPLAVRIGMIGLGVFLLIDLPFGYPPEFAGTTLNDFGRFYTLGIPAIMIIAGAALGRDIGKTAWSAPFIAIGDASYSLYLVHPFVVLAFLTLFRRAGLLGVVPPQIYVGLIVVFSLFTCIFSYKMFERPSARKVTDWLAPRASP